MVRPGYVVPEVVPMEWAGICSLNTHQGPSFRPSVSRGAGFDPATFGL